MLPHSPIGARRVRTDLQTSENVFVQPGRSRSNSPLLPRHYQHHHPAAGIQRTPAAYLTIPESGAGSPRITITAYCCTSLSPSPNRVRSQSSGAASPSTRQTTTATITKSPSRTITSPSSLAATSASAATTTRFVLKNYDVPHSELAEQYSVSIYRFLVPLFWFLSPCCRIVFVFFFLRLRISSNNMGMN